MIASAKLATTSTFSLLSNLKIQPIDFVICSKLLTSSGSTIARRAIGGKYRCGIAGAVLAKTISSLEDQRRPKAVICLRKCRRKPTFSAGQRDGMPLP